MSTTIERISDTERFTALREEWNELLRDSQADGLFLTWEWLHTWWKYHTRGRRLALLTVREGRDLVGLAPLTLRAGSRGLASSKLEFLGSGIIGSDYLDVILRRGREGQALAAIVEHLDSERLRMDLVRVRRNSASAGELADGLKRRGWLVITARTHTCPFIRLEGHTWNSYQATLGHSHRCNLRRRLRRAAGGDLGFLVARSPRERQQAFSELVRLHGLRWGNRTEAFYSPAIVAFHEEMTAIALDRGWLRLSLLMLAGAAIAAVYGFRYGGTFYYFQAGFDPAHAGLSPGLLALGLSIKAAVEEGIGEYDLLHGDEPYKSLWAHETRPLSCVELYPATVRETVYASTRMVGRTTKRMVRQVLPMSLTAWLSEARRRQQLESIRCSDAS